MANIIGLIVLAGLTGGFAAVVPDEEVRRPMWLFIYFALAAGAIFCWNHDEAPDTPASWLFWAFGSVVIAGIYFAFEGLIAYLSDPSVTFLESATSNRSFFTVLMISPFGTFIALSGWARSLISSRSRSRG